MTDRLFSWDSSRSVSFVQLWSKSDLEEKKTVTGDQLVDLVTELKLPLRDIRQLQRPLDDTKKRVNAPVLHLVNGDCFVLKFEDIKLVCNINTVFIFHSETCGGKRLAKLLKERNSERRNKDSGDEQSFQNMVMVGALEVVVEKFRRNLRIHEPALESLLKDITDNPETNGLRRLLAVKKSLSGFEQRLELFQKVVTKAHSENEESIRVLDFKTKTDREEALENCLADLDEIDTEIKITMENIEDTNQFISAHLDHVRNEIMRLSLKIEIAAFIMGFGAVIGGVFGMNLHSGLEDDKYIFHVVWVVLLVISFGIIAFFYKISNNLKRDTTSATDYKILKNFFTYVDDLENLVEDKTEMTKEDFKDAVRTITKLDVSDQEVTYLFSMFDTDHDGVLNTEKELNIKISFDK